MSTLYPDGDDFMAEPPAAPAGETPPLSELLEKARHHVMTPEEKDAQRQSWVRGEMELSEYERGMTTGVAPPAPAPPCQGVTLLAPPTLAELGEKLKTLSADVEDEDTRMEVHYIGTQLVALHGYAQAPAPAAQATARLGRLRILAETGKAWIRTAGDTATDDGVRVSPYPDLLDLIDAASQNAALRAKVAEGESIRHAEKKILIDEITKNAALATKVGELEAEVKAQAEAALERALGLLRRWRQHRGNAVALFPLDAETDALLAEHGKGGGE